MEYADSMLLCVYFDHLLQCGLVNDIYYCFKTMMVVEMFGFFFEKLAAYC